MTDFMNQKSDVRRQLERATRELNRYRKQEEEASANKPKFSFFGWLDRTLMEAAVHTPVFVAIGISIFGWEQYGWFAAGLIPLTCSLSWLLSRSYAKLINAHRADVAVFLVVLGALAFCTEAYGVHLGLERFNHYNAANGLQTFDGSILILVSIMLGLMNLFSRWGYVTGEEHSADRSGRAETKWFWHRRRDNFETALTLTEARDELKNGMNIKDHLAVKCFKTQGGWPMGYKPSAAALEAIAA